MAHTTSKLLRGESRERQRKAKWEAMNKGQQVNTKGSKDHGVGWCTGGKGLDRWEPTGICKTAQKRGRENWIKGQQDTQRGQWASRDKEGGELKAKQSNTDGKRSQWPGQERVLRQKRCEDKVQGEKFPHAQQKDCSEDRGWTPEFLYIIDIRLPNRHNLQAQVRSLYRCFTFCLSLNYFRPNIHIL